jgi:ribosomal protein S18 acetylase RimI-like enzyme
MAVVIREASDPDIAALAALRWQWHEERHGPLDGSPADFARSFLDWWSSHGSRFRAALVIDGDDVVGMGFVALVDRVPKPGDLERHHGDIQSVYLAPEHRGRGLGSQLVRLLLDLAAAGGCDRTEVHSGRRAVPFYERAGFEHDQQLLNHSGRSGA